MDLAIDVGNTTIMFGFFDSKKGNYDVKHFFRMSTPTLTTTDEFSTHFNGLLKFHRLDNIAINKSILSSVVPSINHNITKMMNLYFNCDVIELDKSHFKKMSIDYNTPSDVGIDRLVNVTAAKELYGVPAIVIDYGTAITIDVLSKDNVFLGGLIIPGINIALDVLIAKTAKLPNIELDYPKRIIGKSTKECMQNGLYYLNSLGADAVVEEIIREVLPRENNDKIQVVATGGLSHFMAKKSKKIKHINNQMSLIGLKILLDDSM